MHASTVNPHMTVAEHDQRSEERFNELKYCVKKHSEKVRDSMGAREDMNIIGGHGGYDGFGGGGLGLIALLALLGRRDGLFGGNGDGVSGLNNLQGAIDTNAILSKLGTIEGAIPLAEAQTQLAIANSTAAIQAQGFASQLATQAGFANVGDKVDALSAAQALGFGVTGRQIAETGWAVTQAVQNDGEKTRALIGQIDRENLNRLISTQAAELAELRNESARERDRHGIEINMVNNQNQNQLQFQQQAQVLGSLAHALSDVSQVARATNQAINIGSGVQTANPTNSATNVRA